MSTVSSWSRGYPVGSAYPPSWHAFQSPAHLRLVCAICGVDWDVDEQGPLAIAEIGCGTGYTAQLLAAGNPRWQVVGLDYNPAHIAEARALTRAAGLDNLAFHEADLAELDDAALDALPAFDVVTVHGMWSWVADPVREGVLRLIRRRLKPGGLVLMSYNALPGAAGSLGLAALVRRSLDLAASPMEGLAQAGARIQALTEAQAEHLPDSPWRRMLAGEPSAARPGYLLHEFSTAHWRPAFHADVAAAMGTARCDYVGSATLDENFPQMSLSPEQLRQWDEAPDALTRELIFDLCVKRPFRRDLYVRGRRPVSRDAAVDALTLALVDGTPGERVLLTQLGSARLPQATIDAAMAALGQGPQTIAALRALPACQKVNPSEMAALLVGSGCAAPVWRKPGDPADDAAALDAARRFNAVAASRLAQAGRAAGQFGLAVPMLGGALRATSLELAMAHCLQGRAPGEVSAAQVLAQLVPDDRAIDDEMRQGLTAAIEETLHTRWPLWRAMGVA